MGRVPGLSTVFLTLALHACDTRAPDGDDTDVQDTDASDTDPQDTDTGDTDVAATCADLTGGALITVQVVDDSFSFWSTNGAFIDQAKVLLETSAVQVPVFDTITLGAGCDPQWSWTVDPAGQSWADVTIEVCDGTPSYIEGDPAAWLASPGQWCPWAAVVTAVDDRR